MTNASTPNDVALTGKLIGQTEKATRAVLDALLAETATTFHQWVALQLAATTGGDVERSGLVGQMADGLKISPADAASALDEDIGLGLVTAAGETVAVSPAGSERYERIAAGIAGITARLYGALPAEDLETTRRVLTIVKDRANVALAGTR